MVSTLKTDEATSQRMKAVIDHYDCVIGNYKNKIKMYEQAIENIKAEIREEKEFAYADFEMYKVDYLGCDAEYVEDELPNNDYRYGMERCLEIIRKHTKVGE